jgi:hypothetical protein
VLVRTETRVRDHVLTVLLCGAVLMLPAVLLARFMPPVLTRRAEVRQDRILLRPASSAYEDILVQLHRAPTRVEREGVDLVLTGPGGAYKVYLQIAFPGLSCVLKRDGGGPAVDGTFEIEVIQSWMRLGGLNDETTERAGEASELEQLVRRAAGGADLFETASSFHYFDAEKMTGAVYIWPTLSAYLQMGFWFAVWLGAAVFVVLRALRESRRGTVRTTPTGI